MSVPATFSPRGMKTSPKRSMRSARRAVRAVDDLEGGLGGAALQRPDARGRVANGDLRVVGARDLDVVAGRAAGAEARPAGDAKRHPTRTVEEEASETGGRVGLPVDAGVDAGARGDASDPVPRRGVGPAAEAGIGAQSADTDSSAGCGVHSEHADSGRVRGERLQPVPRGGAEREDGSGNCRPDLAHVVVIAARDGGGAAASPEAHSERHVARGASSREARAGVHRRDVAASAAARGGSRLRGAVGESEAARAGADDAAHVEQGARRGAPTSRFRWDRSRTAPCPRPGSGSTRRFPRTRRTGRRGHRWRRRSLPRCRARRFPPRSWRSRRRRWWDPMSRRQSHTRRSPRWSWPGRRRLGSAPRSTRPARRRRCQTTLRTGRRHRRTRRTRPYRWRCRTHPIRPRCSRRTRRASSHPSSRPAGRRLPR